MEKANDSNPAHWRGFFKIKKEGVADGYHQKKIH